jgi:hypothetical protein
MNLTPLARIESSRGALNEAIFQLFTNTTAPRRDLLSVSALHASVIKSENTFHSCKKHKKKRATREEIPNTKYQDQGRRTKAKHSQTKCTQASTPWKHSLQLACRYKFVLRLNHFHSRLKSFLFSHYIVGSTPSTERCLSALVHREN